MVSYTKYTLKKTENTTKKGQSRDTATLDTRHKTMTTQIQHRELIEVLSNIGYKTQDDGNTNTTPRTD